MIKFIYKRIRRRIIRWQRMQYIKELVKEADNEWLHDGKRRYVLPLPDGRLKVVTKKYKDQYNRLAKKHGYKTINYHDMLTMSYYITPEGNSGHRNKVKHNWHNLKKKIKNNRHGK